jgi:SecD/SecF fusion protein
MNIFKRLKEKNDRVWAKFYDPRTHIANKGKWYAFIPSIIILVGVILLCIPSVGFNLGLDFTGGTVIEGTNIQTSADAAAARDLVDTYLREQGIKHDISTPFSDKTMHGISIKYQSKRGATAEENKVISDGIVAIVGEYTTEVKPTESISASASGERILMTFISIMVALIAILIYMLFRFKFTSGISAVIGLLHDVLVTVALCAIFRVQINYSFVAAIITVVVYSLNNTIVLFDRIRGKEKQIKSMGSHVPVEQTVDAAIKETFARTMGTTITTLVPVLALCCLPVPLIREFALPIFFVLLAGALSTLFITTSLYVRFEKYRGVKQRTAEKLKKQDSLI